MPRAHDRPQPPFRNMNYSGNVTPFPAGRAKPLQIGFERKELTRILDLYGRMVAAGKWRDYAMDMNRDAAIFSAFRRASRTPAIPHRKTAGLEPEAGYVDPVRRKRRYPETRSRIVGNTRSFGTQADEASRGIKWEGTAVSLHRLVLVFLSFSKYICIHGDIEKRAALNLRRDICCLDFELCVYLWRIIFCAIAAIICSIRCAGISRTLLTRGSCAPCCSNRMGRPNAAFRIEYRRSAPETGSSLDLTLRFVRNTAEQLLLCIIGCVGLSSRPGTHTQSSPRNVSMDGYCQTGILHRIS